MAIENPDILINSTRALKYIAIINNNKKILIKKSSTHLVQNAIEDKFNN